MKALAIIAATLAAVSALAADIAPTSYFPGYTYSNATVHIPLTNLTGLTAAQATTDVRAVAYRLVDALYSGLAAKTNAPVYFTIARETGYRTSGTNINEFILHRIETITRRAATPTIPTE